MPTNWLYRRLNYCRQSSNKSGQSSSAFWRACHCSAIPTPVLVQRLWRGRNRGKPAFLLSLPHHPLPAASHSLLQLPVKKVRDLQATHTKSRPVHGVGSSRVVRGHEVAQWFSKGVGPPCCCPALSSLTCCPAPCSLPEHQPHLQLCSQVRTTSSLQKSLTTTDTPKCCFQALLCVFLGTLTWPLLLHCCYPVQRACIVGKRVNKIVLLHH